MRVATFNVNSLRVRQQILLDWMEEAQPDVVCLQELKMKEDKFPSKAIAEAGYEHQVVWGQATYNGVAMLSKTPIDKPYTGFRVGPKDKQARLVQGTVNGVRILGCYAPNGTKLSTDKFAYKLTWYARLLRELSVGTTNADDVLVCGDMNIAHTANDVKNPNESAGRLHYHPLEHDTFNRLLGWGLVDAYRSRNPDSKDFTWWDYRMDAFNRDMGLRIDYMLASESLNKRITDVTQWKGPRSLEKPSDHIPVTIDIA